MARSREVSDSWEQPNPKEDLVVKKSRLPLFIVVIAVLAGVIWLIASNEDAIETFADGVTGNQAVREGGRTQEQVRDISDEHNRRLEEVMGH